MMYPYFLPGARRITRPTDCTTSTTDFRGFRNITASNAGTSTPSDRHRALDSTRQVSSASSAVSQSGARCGPGRCTCRPRAGPDTPTAAPPTPPVPRRLRGLAVDGVGGAIVSTTALKVRANLWDWAMVPAKATARRIGCGSIPKECSFWPRWPGRSNTHDLGDVVESQLAVGGELILKVRETWCSSTARTRTL